MAKIGDLRTRIGFFKSTFNPSDSYIIQDNKHFLGEAWAQITPVMGNKQVNGLSIYNDNNHFSHMINLRQQEFVPDVSMWVAHSGQVSLRWWRIINVRENGNDKLRFITINCRLFEREDTVKKETREHESYKMPNVSNAGYV
jgi:hypothetical protein